jgi:hypothetical protein
LVIFIILLVGAVLAFVFKDKVTGFLKTEMEDSLASKYGNDQAITDAWNSAQENVSCNLLLSLLWRLGTVSI